MSRPADDLRRFAVANARPLGAVAFLVAGAVFVLLGWYGAAHTNIITEQIPYLISGGLLGLGLMIVAGFLAYSTGVERELRALRAHLSSGPAPDGGAAPAPAQANGALYALPGGRSFHEAGCPIIEGKDGVRALSQQEASSLSPCKLCEQG